MMMEKEHKDFPSLLSSRKAKRKKLSTSERQVLHDAVFQLVTYHSSVDSVVQEAKGIKLQDLYRKDSKGSQSPEFLQDILKTCFHNENSESRCSFMVVENVVAKLLLIFQNQDGKQIFSYSEKIDIQAHVSCLCSTVQEQSFQKPRLLNLLCKEKCLPILCLWCLHKEEVMTLGSYLTYKSNDSGFVPAITDGMIGYLQSLKTDRDRSVTCRDDNSLWDDSSVFKEFTHQLINFAFTEQADSKVCKKVSKAVLEQFITKMLDTLTSKSVMYTLCIPDLISGCQADVAKKFCAFSIQTMLGYMPVYKVADALSSKDWTFARLEDSLTEWLKMMLLLFDPVSVLDLIKQVLEHQEMLLPFDSVSVLDLIKQVLEHQEVNWHLVLSFLSTLLICLPDVSTPLQDYIQESLKSGLENSNIEELVIGFLFARQACSEGSHVFMSYGDWFQRLFGDGSRSLANSRKTFTVFMKFLTDIVPFDQPQYLKVHIVRPPYVPPKCRELLADYLLLAKTRLSDLKQPIENDGMFEDSSSSSTDRDLTSQLEGDVQKAVSAYSVNKKIPSAVMEASIFRKPYFIGKFLPVLLKPRPLPDIPDLRMNFIEALKKIEKIPANLYSSYTDKCKAEAARLLDGAFPEEEGYDDMELSPLDQLSSRLENLLSAVKSSISDVSEAVTLVRERLLSLCEEDQNNTTVRGSDDVIDIDLNDANLSNNQLKICDILLNFYCKAMVDVSDMKTPSYYWAACLIDLTTEIDILHKALLCRLWTLIFHQGHELDGSHTRGLACLLVHMSLKQKCLTPVRVTYSWKQCQPFIGVFLYLLWEHLPYYTSQWMVFALRLTSEYISTALQACTSVQLTELKEQIFPSPLCKIFLYMCRRLVSDKDHTGHMILERDSDTQSVLQLAHTVYKSKKVKDLLKSHELTVEEWLSYEINVSMEEDILCLPDRQQYIHDTIYNTYLRSSGDTSNPVDNDNDITTVCSMLLLRIVNTDLRSSGDTSKPVDNDNDITTVCSTLLLRIVNTDLRYLCPRQTSVCQRCSANCRACRYQSNRPAFITLLQELCYMLPSPESEKNGCLPWLIQQLKNLTEKSDQKLSALENQTKVQVFMRVAQCLPAHLFFCDTLQMDAYSFIESVNVINTTMRNSLCEGISLTVCDTMYFLKGISQVDPTTSAGTRIFTDCPLLTVSSLVHHKHTGHLLRKMAGKNNGEVMNEIVAAVGFLERIPEPYGELKPPDIKNIWIKVGILLAFLSAGECWRNSCDSVPEMLFNTCEKETDIQTVFVVILGQLSVNQIQNIKMVDKNDADSNLVMVMLRKYQSMCIEALNWLLIEKVCICIPDYVQRLLPWTLLKFLRRSGDSVIVPNHLNHILSLYAQLAELVDGALVQHENPKSVFPMQELIELNMYVKEVITNSTTAELQRIDRSLLKRCGIDVAMEFTEMMKKTSH